MVHRRMGLAVGSLVLGAAIAVPIMGLPGTSGSSAGVAAALACRGQGSTTGCPSPTGDGAPTTVAPTAMVTFTPTPTLAAPVATGLTAAPPVTPGPSQPPSVTPAPTGAAGAISPIATPGRAVTPTAPPTSAPTAPPTSRPTPTATRSPAPTYLPTASPAPTPTPTPAPTATPKPAWTMVVNDQFNSGGVPSHWTLYDAPYGSGAGNCADPSHVTVSGGYMHIRMSYQTSGACGPGWYTGGMMISDAYGSVDQRVTVRFRVVNNGVQGHYIIPMRWPDTAPWPSGGEEDFCESSDLAGCTTFLHYGSNNSQISRDYAVNLAQWHTMRFTRLKDVVTAAIDGNVVWTYKGSSATLPATVKRVVLQQECQSSCPSGTSGSEDIQIDWITIEDPTG
jgi:hypothetical protein